MEKEKKIRHQWKILTKKVTHERGVWPLQENYGWKLDPTEGPSRMRIRLKPMVPPALFLVPSRKVSSMNQESPSTGGLISPGKTS